MLTCCRFRIRAATLLPVVLAAAFTASSAHAQEARRPALVIGGPGQVGVLLPRNRWSIRPDFTISGSLSYAEGATVIGPHSSVAPGVGVSFLRYAKPTADSLRLYAVTRLGYQTLLTTSDGFSPDFETFEAQLALGGGAHFQPTDRLGLFAELHASYVLRRNAYSSAFGNSSTFTQVTWQLRPMVGATLRRGKRSSG
jgi:hypothetical protein